MGRNSTVDGLVRTGGVASSPDLWAPWLHVVTAFSMQLIAFSNLSANSSLCFLSSTVLLAASALLFDDILELVDAADEASPLLSSIYFSICSKQSLVAVLISPIHDLAACC